MIDFTTHELELIGDSIALELEMPLLDSSPNCPRALQLRKIQSRIQCFLEAKEAIK
jgi:hypothetical protein|tara:strand:- start:59 stop:226 length:168 start_codon:yes stop_codon:yes gene_type:complete